MSSILPNKLPEHALQPKGFRRVASLSFPHDYRELAAVFVGGALGTVARTGLSLLMTADPARWPWPTFTVNIVGAFLLGYFTTRLLERLPLSSYRRPLLGTGLCGGLTTFSTMQVETLKMIEHHHYGLAAGYTCASIVFGFLAVYLATALVRRVPVRR
jgi:fluoride exporter